VRRGGRRRETRRGAGLLGRGVPPEPRARRALEARPGRHDRRHEGDGRDGRAAHGLEGAIDVQEPVGQPGRRTTPVIADNTLYIRADGHLYAFSEQK